MNISKTSSVGSENNCKSRYVFNSIPWRNSLSDSFYGLLVGAAVFSLATCSFTILLNAVVMVAVKTKRRLQRNANILLACLALTDLMVGLVVQPLHITKTIFLLQGKEFHELCDIDLAFTVSYLTFVVATACHLVLISGERYLAIKHTFIHFEVITKTRLMISSTVAWIAALTFFPIVSYLPIYLFVSQGTILFLIVFFQILVYKEAHRHEKQILSQQVSLEARAKFNQEKKALKLTTIILVAIILCFTLPSIFALITQKLFKEKFTPEVKALVLHLGRLPVILNSVLNPVIYSVRKREFRVAFIELLLRKTFQEADEFDKRLFGSPNNVVRLQLQRGQEGEGTERNGAERNVAQANVNREDNPEVFASGANLDENNTVARQNKPGSSSTHNIASEKTQEEIRNSDDRNVAKAIDNHEDYPEVFASGANFDDNNTVAKEKKPGSSSVHNSISEFKTQEDYGLRGNSEDNNVAEAIDNHEDFSEVLACGANLADHNTVARQYKPGSSSSHSSTSEKTQEDYGKRRNSDHGKKQQEDDPEVLASCANLDDNNTVSRQNKPVSSNAHNSTSKKTQKDHGTFHGERRNSKDRNVAQAIDSHEDNPEVLASGANLDDNNTVAKENKPCFSSAHNSTSEKTQEDHDERRNSDHGKKQQEHDPEVLAPGVSFERESTDPTPNESLSSNESIRDEETQLQIRVDEFGEPLDIETVEELTYDTYF
ncbi:uncharacterized protein LOC144629763 [Oculina patagonica]